jgi:hypothetical protein
LENGAFQGLSDLQTLGLTDNPITELNLTDATFGSLTACELFVRGFCVDSFKITDLILDDALLSEGSFEAIVHETRIISNVSLVGLSFSDSRPDDLSDLLTIPTLQNVRVDQTLFDLYAAELDAFEAIPGHTVTLISLLPGDYNSDGVVDQADLDLVLLTLGEESVNLDAVGWINDLPSGPIGQEELDRVLFNWGASVDGFGVGGVPEPSAATIALAAICLIASIRRVF